MQPGGRSVASDKALIVRFDWAILVVLIVVVLGAMGCRTTGKPASDPPSPPSSQSYVVHPVSFDDDGNRGESATEAVPEPADLPTPSTTEVLTTPPPSKLSLEAVVRSVRNNFPLIRQAAAARGIAAGEALSAAGAFDHKLNAMSQSQPLDFYENYRHSIGVKRDTMWGGQTFAGYRIGRGIFEPWYLERETNNGGEFKAGFMAPIIGDRWIDANRAALWQAQLEMRRVEPEIMAAVIRFVRDGSVAYWQWVAAGANYRIAEGLLELARTRNEGLEEQVRATEKAPIDLVDNRRIIVSRDAKRIDARRKLQQAAVKLSLFYRSADGLPLLADDSLLPQDWAGSAAHDGTLSGLLVPNDTSLALEQRPELTELQIVREQLDVALRQANNETLPNVDGGVLVAQDVGEPTSEKRDKSEMKLEAQITVSVPLQRRKALGKIRSLRWKLAQLDAKNRFTADKIVADVQMASAALFAARERVDRASESYDLSVQMREAEQELFDQGQSTLFNLNIREQQAAEAAQARVDALLEYHIAATDYAAALGYSTPPE